MGEEGARLRNERNQELEERDPHQDQPTMFAPYPGNRMVYYPDQNEDGSIDTSTIVYLIQDEDNVWSYDLSPDLTQAQIDKSSEAIYYLNNSGDQNPTRESFNAYYDTLRTEDTVEEQIEEVPNQEPSQEEPSQEGPSQEGPSQEGPIEEIPNPISNPQTFNNKNVRFAYGTPDGRVPETAILTQDDGKFSVYTWNGNKWSAWGGNTPVPNHTDNESFETYLNTNYTRGPPSQENTTTDPTITDQTTTSKDNIVYVPITADYDGDQEIWYKINTNTGEATSLEDNVPPKNVPGRYDGLLDFYDDYPDISVAGVNNVYGPINIVSSVGYGAT